MAVQEGWDSPGPCPQAALPWAQLITAPGSDLQGELGVHLLPSIEGMIIVQHRILPQALSGFSGEINSTAGVPYILPWLVVPLHS